MIEYGLRALHPISIQHPIYAKENCVGPKQTKKCYELFDFQNYSKLLAHQNWK